MGAAALANVFIYQWPVYYIARVRPTDESSTFAVLIDLVLLAMSFGVSLSQPLWAAIADAAARGDREWIRRVIVKARGSALTYGAACMLTFGLGANQILNLWLRRSLRVPPDVCWFAGIYLLLAVWEYVHWPLMLGLGAMRRASNLVFLRAVVAAGLTALGGRTGSRTVMATLCISIVLTSAWLYPRFLRRALVRLA
jgi:O-antigen/teichoic acid export membrane protein